LAYFVNIQQPLGKLKIAMFYTRCYLLALFRKLASVGRRHTLLQFWCSVDGATGNVYGF